MVRRCDGATVRGVLGALLLAFALSACSADADDSAPSNPPSGPGTAAQSNSGTVAPSHLALSNSETLVPVQSVGAVKFDSGRAYEDLRRQVACGPRPAGSAALAQCRKYLLDQLAAAGIEAREDAFDAATPFGQVRMVNIIGTIPGKRTDRIAIATHYDTKLFDRIQFVGASDGASSTAAVLELGRVLKGRQNEYTIELLFFDGEEAVVDWYRNNDNTYGSRHYVEAARKARTLSGLKALVLLDMIGDRNLTIRRDSNSTRWLTDIIWAAAARLGYQSYFLSEQTTIDDDHMPFMRSGVPSVDIIDLDYPAWHTADDDLDHVSARSLQIVGDVVLDALPQLEKRLASTP